VITQEIITVLDRDDAINTGLYAFTLTQNGVQQQVSARYTFVYQGNDGVWLIVNHHLVGRARGLHVLTGDAHPEPR
jgi:hypothetical protein